MILVAACGKPEFLRRIPCIGHDHINLCFVNYHTFKINIVSAKISGISIVLMALEQLLIHTLLSVCPVRIRLELPSIIYRKSSV